jgi:plasmid stabilization system protein ParE
MNGCKSIQITQAAQDDLLAAYWFYEHQQAGIGDYFLNSLYADIDALQISAGVHAKVQPSGAYRSLGSRFPFAIYYLIQGSEATVLAVLDTRRSPEWLQERQSSSRT